MATLTLSTRARTAGAGAEQNYELNQSDSIDFCFNLMSDPHAHLSQTDIMDIFSSLQRRERDLPFLVSELGATDAQGVRWPAQRELRRKFDLDRARVGRSATGWFRSVPSRARVRHVCTGDALHPALLLTTVPLLPPRHLLCLQQVLHPPQSQRQPLPAPQLGVLWL